MAPILIDVIGHGHSFSPKLLTLPELEPIEAVSHSLPKGLVVCLEAFEMYTKARRTPAHHRCCGSAVVGTGVSGCNVSDRQRFGTGFSR